MRRSALLLALCLLPTAGRAQDAVYLHPGVGVLDLDFEPLPGLGVEIDEGILVGTAIGLDLSERWTVEVGYASAGFEIRSDLAEPIEGRFHLFSVGPRATLLATDHLVISASLAPGVVIATTELTDATRNLALPAGLDLVVPLAGSVGVRTSVRDYLHRCDPPEGFDDVICEDGQWLHHVSGSVGLVVRLRGPASRAGP